MLPWLFVGYLMIAAVLFCAMMWHDRGAPDFPGVRIGTLGCTTFAIFWIYFVVCWLFEKDEGENP